MLDKIFKYVAIVITIFSGIMIYWHWDHHEVSAWIIAFTGWFNFTLDLIKKGNSNV